MIKLFFPPDIYSTYINFIALIFSAILSCDNMSMQKKKEKEKKVVYAYDGKDTMN